MKRGTRALVLLLLLVLPLSAGAQQRVFDNAGVLSAAEEQQITTAVEAFISETGMDYAVLTISEPLGSQTQHELTRAYYRSLGLGVGDNASGALYCLNFDPDNRAETIYVDGDMMYYMTDDRQNSVLDQTNPLLIKGEYATAALTAINVVKDYVKKGIPEGQYIYDEETGQIVSARYKIITATEFMIGAAACLLIGLAFILIVSSRYKLKGSTYHYDYAANTDVNMTDSDDKYLRTTVTRTRRAQPPSGGGGGFGGGGRTTMSGGGGSSSSRGF